MAAEQRVGWGDGSQGGRRGGVGEGGLAGEHLGTLASKSSSKLGLLGSASPCAPWVKCPGDFQSAFLMYMLAEASFLVRRPCRISRPRRA